MNIRDVDRLVFSHLTCDGLGVDQMVELFGDTSIPAVYVTHWSHPTMRFKFDSDWFSFLAIYLACVDYYGLNVSVALIIF